MSKGTITPCVGTGCGAAGRAAALLKDHKLGEYSWCLVRDEQALHPHHNYCSHIGGYIGKTEKSYYPSLPDTGETAPAVLCLVLGPCVKRGMEKLKCPKRTRVLDLQGEAERTELV